MMNVGSVGAKSVLAIRFNETWPAGGKNLTLKLFTNNIVPAKTDVAATYTEASGGGYAAKTLTKGSWTVNDGPPANVTYAAQTFTFTGALDGGATIYGYYVVDADGVFQWSELLSNPETPAASGDNVVVNPYFGGSSGIPA